ncbi:hypothetical protein F2Q70_00003055 [Brassica cretica]|uniref:Uncharacterized protein n=1 Tax=Brassica cretica TaxID=69181 RepID=A0A8S9J1K5_BRACR|nr:hypothetical protein F2Q70_00003055 [Brassica cretica]
MGPVGLDPGFVLARNYGFAGTVFYRPEAGHYRVPVLHAASAEATIRLIKVLLVWMKIQLPDFTTLHVWSSSRVLPVLARIVFGDPDMPSAIQGEVELGFKGFMEPDAALYAPLIFGDVLLIGPVPQSSGLPFFVKQVQA